MFVNSGEVRKRCSGKAERKTWIPLSKMKWFPPPHPAHLGLPKASCFWGELPYLGFSSEEGVAHVADSPVGVLLVAHAVDVDVGVVLKRDAECSRHGAWPRAPAPRPRLHEASKRASGEGQ